MVLLNIIIEHSEVDDEVAADHGSQASEDRDDNDYGSMDRIYVLHKIMNFKQFNIIQMMALYR